ncbi:MAG: PilZ domain-containing protein [Spirochaetes bacterium]|nr:PilZ domain-containing protein [Spirochaetota bacterium]
MDNRKLPKMQYASNVELINKDISIKGQVHDLSMSGMYVETSGKLEPETDVDVKISLGENSNKFLLKLKGIIKRLDNKGMAVEFTDEKNISEILSQFFQKTESLR